MAAGTVLSHGRTHPAATRGLFTMRTLRLLLVALAVLALTGSGMSVASQEPAGGEGLLPGVDLVTEEVEPGVFHVLSDGIRELSRPVEFLWLEEWGWG